MRVGNLHEPQARDDVTKKPTKGQAETLLPNGDPGRQRQAKTLQRQ